MSEVPLYVLHVTETHSCLSPFSKKGRTEDRVIGLVTTILGYFRAKTKMEKLFQRERGLKVFQRERGLSYCRRPCPCRCLAIWQLKQNSWHDSRLC